MSRQSQHEGNTNLLLGVNHARNATARWAGRRSEDLVGGSQFGPRLVGPAVVVLSLGDLHVLVEAQDLSGLQFSNCGSLTQLQDERSSSRFTVLHQCGRVSTVLPHLPRQPPLDLSNLSLSVSLVFGCVKKKIHCCYSPFLLFKRISVASSSRRSWKTAPQSAGPS